jgi:hypothetical protein
VAVFESIYVDVEVAVLVFVNVGIIVNVSVTAVVIVAVCCEPAVALIDGAVSGDAGELFFVHALNASANGQKRINNIHNIFFIINSS